MLLSENNSDWKIAYNNEIKLANMALANSGMYANLCSVMMDMYCLPFDNHQTFYVKLLSEGGFDKIIYAKPLQNSVWFSEEINNRTFAEAEEFKTHPMKKGRILCKGKLIPKSLINHLLRLMELISDCREGQAVKPDAQKDFMAIRCFENGEVVREVYFTDPELLSFPKAPFDPKWLEYVEGLHLKIEEIIGTGDTDTMPVYRG